MRKERREEMNNKLQRQINLKIILENIPMLGRYVNKNSALPQNLFRSVGLLKK